MRGSLALRSGVLFVGRYERTAHVRPYDLDGAPLGAGFSFRGVDGAACTLGGIAVDADRHLWVADERSSGVRAFSLFGRPVRSVPGLPGDRDARGVIGAPTDVAIAEPGGEGERGSVWVAQGGLRRHAVQRFAEDGSWAESLRPLGDAHGRFERVSRVASRGPFTYVCEPSAGRIQVFRRGEFHFPLRAEPRPGARFEPAAAAPLEDGRIVVAAGGEHPALLLFDAGGRLVRVLAEGGLDGGRVSEPSDLVVAEDGREPRIAVIDRDAERVQVFTLGGRCYGAFPELPGLEDQRDRRDA